MADSKEVLGEEELKTVLFEAIRAKKARNYLLQYTERINQPRVWPTYTAEQLMKAFEKEYLRRYEVPFIWDEYSRPVLEALCLYFTQDQRFEELKEGYSLKKGLLLQGPVGCGKSSIMRIFGNNQKQSYQYAECPAMIREFSKTAYENYAKYTYPTLNPHPSQQHWGHAYLGWCFDDLGFETIGKHYGKTSNFMMEIIQGIESNLEVMAGMTHFTTNLTADEIELYYGNRIRSRMRMIYNPINYHQEAPDRRK